MEFGTLFYNLVGDIKKFLEPPKNTHTNNFGGYKMFLEPPQIYLQTKHRKWIFSATIHLTRKRLIFPGRYLKADHFGKKIGHEWWATQKC